MLHTATSILFRPLYFFMTICIAIIFFLLSIFLPHIQIFSFVDYSWWQKIYLSIDEMLFVMRVDIVTAIFTIIISCLFSYNIALLIYHIRTQMRVHISAGTSTLAVIISLFGLGCASCGTVLLTSLFGVGFSTTVLGILPFYGLEFSIVSILILVWSIFLLLKKIQSPQVCKI